MSVLFFSLSFYLSLFLTLSLFLEVDITVKYDKFVIKIFDQRDDFNFKIVKFPHIKSNIPNCIVFNVFVSQIIRIARVCSYFQSLKDIFKVLILKS